jgi:hypothetical protein
MEAGWGGGGGGTAGSKEVKICSVSIWHNTVNKNWRKQNPTENLQHFSDSADEDVLLSDSAKKKIHRKFLAVDKPLMLMRRRNDANNYDITATKRDNYKYITGSSRQYV